MACDDRVFLMNQENLFIKSTGVVICLCFGFFILVTSAPYSQASEHNPREILKNVDDMMRGESSTGRFTMTVNTTHWTRTLTVQFWTKEDDKLLMKILSPKKERGIATLKSGRNIWNYLPNTNRVIKLPSASLGSSWMGSHFNYDDLLKNSSLADDFDYEITSQEKRGDLSIVEITCVPKPGVPLVWGKVDVTVNMDDNLPLLIRYYEEDGMLVRTLVFTDVTREGGRNLPKRHRMIPAGKPDEFTEVFYEKIEFDPVIDESFFSLRRLKQ